MFLASVAYYLSLCSAQQVRVDRQKCILLPWMLKFGVNEMRSSPTIIWEGYYKGCIRASNSGPERRKIHSYLKERKDKGVLDSRSRTVEYKDLNEDKQIDIEIRIHGYLKEGKIKEC